MIFDLFIPVKNDNFPAIAKDIRRLSSQSARASRALSTVLEYRIFSVRPAFIWLLQFILADFH